MCVLSTGMVLAYHKYHGHDYALRHLICFVKVAVQLTEVPAKLPSTEPHSPGHCIVYAKQGGQLFLFLFFLLLQPSLTMLSPEGWRRGNANGFQFLFPSFNSLALRTEPA